MRLLGVLFALGGWLIALAGLFMTQGNLGRGLFAGVGIAVSLVGIFGFINGYHLSKANWKN
jgi:hypothetical protein